MDSEEQFDQLARRNEELRSLASRGRRRSLLMIILAFVPSLIIVIATNNDITLIGVIPVGIACVVTISYSWTKWQRRPEDSQSVAFVGLDRKRQWATFRSMRDGTGIDDPVVLTIVESIHHHLRRSIPTVVVTMVGIAATTIALVEAAGTMHNGNALRGCAIGLLQFSAGGAVRRQDTLELEAGVDAGYRPVAKFGQAAAIV